MGDYCNKLQISDKQEEDSIKRERLDKQALLRQQIEAKKARHSDIMKKKMQERRKKKLAALPEKHDREVAKVCHLFYFWERNIVSLKYTRENIVYFFQP